MYASCEAGLTYMNALDIGVGRQTWKRMSGGMIPRLRSRSKTAHESAAASA